MAGNSIDLEAMRDATVSSGADILPAGQGVRRASHVVVKNWWRYFGYAKGDGYDQECAH
jgi:hypothetical protein